MRGAGRGTVVLVAVLLVAGGCSSGGTRSGNEVRPSSTAELSILAPKPGEQFEDGTDVVVRLELDGATISKTVTKNIEPDTGHIHIRLDAKTVTLLGSLEQTLPEVGEGRHVIEAEFVAADHGPFDPRVIETTNFVVR